MTSGHPPRNDQALNAWVDERLDGDALVAVERWFEEAPERAAEAGAYRGINAKLRGAYGPIEGEPVPPHLLRAARHGRRRNPLLRHAAIALLWLGAGVGLGWTLHDTQLERRVLVNSLVTPAAVAHAVYEPEVRHPVEVPAEQRDHLVRWLSKRIGEPVQAPDLARYGYELVGGRLLPQEAGAAAQFMYEDSQGKRLTLYVRRRPQGREPTAFRYALRDGVGVFYWIDGPLGYALSGRASKETMLDIANAVYEELNP